MAIPTSASSSAGASFIPSPAIATIFPFSCSSFTFLNLSSGRQSAWYPSRANSFATVLAVNSLSPVSIYILMPDFCNVLIALAEVGFIMSATLIIPSVFSPTIKYITVCPCSCHSLTIFSCSSLRPALKSSIRFLLPRPICFPL